MPKYGVWLSLIVGVVLGLFAWQYAPRPVSMPHDVLQIVTQDHRKHVFMVDIPLTVAQQHYGLMNRDVLAADHGMIFIKSTPKIISLWMKNTRIPLDMVFIDDHSRIVFLHENAQPLDLTVISSPQPVRAVVELKAGQIVARGLHLGDEIKFPFKKYIRGLEN